MSEQPERVLTPEEVSDSLQIPVSTLQFWRKTGTGPEWFRAGRYPRYLASDVDAWQRSQRDANKREREDRAHARLAG